MREHEQFIGENFTKRVDRWLRREDTWLAKRLNKISPLKGAEYRVSGAKRRADLTIALVMATATSPATAFILIANTFEKPFGHPFYKQERRETRDRTIEITKFRTMRIDSDSDPNSILTHFAENSPENDPRNTWLGKILRAFELDELPQLFDVISGKLSLIDSRCMASTDFTIVRKQNKPGVYQKWEDGHFEGKPGLFSLNSALNRDRKHILKRRRFDMFYFGHASLGLDQFIIYKTGLRMLRKAEQKVRQFKEKSII